MLVPMKHMLEAASGNGYAVPGFNYYNQSTAEAIAEEAEAQNSPVILMVSGVYLEALGLETAMSIARHAAEKVKTPVAIHLDHGPSYELAEACVKAGFTSVMIDGSHLPYEENVLVTAKVVKMAKAAGVTVEAELGAVGRVEDAVFDEGHTDNQELINPAQAADFVARTGIDCLAPAIGNVHGMTKVQPRLDLELLKTVRKSVAVPLALHGGSGIAPETIRTIIASGVGKVNVGTELKIAWRDGLTAYFSTGKYEPRMAVLDAKASVRKKVLEKITLFGSAGKA